MKRIDHSGKDEPICSWGGASETRPYGDSTSPFTSLGIPAWSDIAALVFVFLVLCAVTTASFGQSESREPADDAPPILLSKDAVKFHPASPETGDKLTMQIKMSEQISSAEVRWSINGDHFDTVHYDGGAESVELNKAIKSGDVIEVEVIPYNMSGLAGRPIQKKVICRKAPPTLKLMDQKIDRNTYSARVEAKDPEDQPVSLAIEGPPGMTIDNNGAITWKLTEKTSGKFDVKVTATDKVGGKAVLDYSFKISRK